MERHTPKNCIRVPHHRIRIKRLTEAQSDLIDAFVTEYPSRVSTAQLEKDLLISELFPVFARPVEQSHLHRAGDQVLRQVFTIAQVSGTDGREAADTLVENCGNTLTPLVRGRPP